MQANAVIEKIRNRKADEIMDRQSVEVKSRIIVLQ